MTISPDKANQNKREPDLAGKVILAHAFLLLLVAIIFSVIKSPENVVSLPVLLGEALGILVWPLILAVIVVSIDLVINSNRDTVRYRKEFLSCTWLFLFIIGVLLILAERYHDQNQASADNQHQREYDNQLLPATNENYNYENINIALNDDEESLYMGMMQLGIDDPYLRSEIVKQMSNDGHTNFIEDLWNAWANVDQRELEAAGGLPFTSGNSVCNSGKHLNYTEKLFCKTTENFHEEGMLYGEVVSGAYFATIEYAARICRLTLNKKYQTDFRQLDTDNPNPFLAYIHAKDLIEHHPNFHIPSSEHPQLCRQMKQRPDIIEYTQ